MRPGRGNARVQGKGKPFSGVCFPCGDPGSRTGHPARASRAASRRSTRVLCLSSGGFRGRVPRRRRRRTLRYGRVAHLQPTAVFPYNRYPGGRRAVLRGHSPGGIGAGGRVQASGADGLGNIPDRGADRLPETGSALRLRADQCRDAAGEGARIGPPGAGPAGGLPHPGGGTGFGGGGCPGGVGSHFRCKGIPRAGLSAFFKGFSPGE